MRLTLTRRGDYGLRLLLHLAALPPETRMTAAEFAGVCEIPAGNVPTIVNTLSRAGILSCRPGRSGGCTLARDPADISILEVIEALEGSFENETCLLDSRRCHEHDPECALHLAWSEGRTAILGALGRTTLASAVEREREIAATK